MSFVAPERRICVEFLPPAELRSPAIVRLLVAHRVAPMLAIRPGDDAPALAALAPYIDAGLGAAAWPLLSDAEGYWPSSSNVVAFTARVVELLETARARALPLPWVAIDLEPSVNDVRRAVGRSSLGAIPSIAAATLARLDRQRFAHAAEKFAALHKRIARVGARTLAIAYPFVSADLWRGSQAMQDLFEAPLGAGWDRRAIMTYGSLVAGYSHGLLTVEDARWYAYRSLGRLVAAYGPRAGAFVGVVGHGKLGDEPNYDQPREIERDVAAARAAGVGDLGLFGLEGILDRSDPERWLAAFADAEPAKPPFRARGEMLHRSIEAGALGVSLLRATIGR